MGPRRTLIQEFVMRDAFSIWVPLYRGHKPHEFSNVDWNHYLDKIEFNPEAINENSFNSW